MPNSNVDDDDKLPATGSNVNDVPTTCPCSSIGEDETESATVDTVDTPVTTNVSKMESNEDVDSAFPQQEGGGGEEEEIKIVEGQDNTRCREVSLPREEEGEEKVLEGEEKVLEGQDTVCHREDSEDRKESDPEQHAATQTRPVTKNDTLSSNDDEINTTQSAFSNIIPLSQGEVSEDDHTEPQGIHFIDSTSEMTNDDEDNANKIQLDSTSVVTPTSPPPPSLHDEQSIKEQECKGTPSTVSMSTTSDDSTSSFSSSEESHFSITLEDSFEQQHSITGSILDFLLQTNKQENKREDQKRKLRLRRRMRIELARELHSSDEEDQPRRRRKPSPPPRHRRTDHSKRTRRKGKTRQHNKAKNQEYKSVVHENKKTRKILGDDYEYMLQEELCLSLCCNAVPSHILDYFGVSTPKRRRARGRHDTDQKRKQRHERHGRQRQLDEENSIQSDGKEVPQNISFDPSDPGEEDAVSACTGLSDDDELKQAAHRMVQVLESKARNGTAGKDMNLSIILEEEETESQERSMDALQFTVSTTRPRQPSTTPPSYRPPTFAC